jgi:hypothetical protein
VKSPYDAIDKEGNRFRCPQLRISPELANASAMKKTLKVESVAARIGVHPSTVFRWLARGCNIDDESSIEEFLSGNRDNRFRNAVRKPVATENTSAEPVAETQETEHVLEPDLNSIELGPVGARGAAAALARLEAIEERAAARLMRAIESGNQFQVKAAQDFFLRASETLRKLDLAVEVERRKFDEQVPVLLVEQISTQISEWLRTAFTQFLSAESPGLMSIKDLGEFKFFAIEKFRGILNRTVKASIGNNSPIPPWASAQVIEAWNVNL